MNLLYDPIIGVETDAGREDVDLPRLMALLGAGRIDAYTGQRPHQADAWHVFTVQLAVSVLARQPTSSIGAPPADPGFWREGLLSLAGGDPHAWALVVDDVRRPAFFQHPLKDEEELEKVFKPEEPKARTPDELDVLVTAKDHDVKASRLPDDDLESWMYALVTYQTISGYLGSGNYGIVRMKGNEGSRPIVALVRSVHPSQRFREEVAVVGAMRNSLLGPPFGYRDDGVVLTWCGSWDRVSHQYHLTDLDPFFIEAPRAVRLVRRGRGAVALGATTKARQIGPKSLENGDVGDPWIPVQTDNKKKGRAALSVSGSGWTPELVCRLLFEEGYELTPLQRPRPAAGALWFVASVLVRGQGTTEGFHRFLLPVPPEAQRRLLVKAERDRLSIFARELQKDARDVEKALAAAMTALIEGGPEKVDFGREAVKAWVSDRMAVFRSSWQDWFFPVLWKGVESGEEQAREDWVERLKDLAVRSLRDAAQVLPLPKARGYRSKTSADGIFWGTLNKKGLTIREVL
ncbi:MAG TPA: type I-E CRISPR-associated protein Cse1/CasA [Syntrophales bacterium]|nr:type I-E CRISPR-associated protein Cse1/CasA [Syntrophales bacterium]